MVPCTSKSYTATMFASLSMAAVRASSSPGMWASERSGTKSSDAASKRRLSAFRLVKAGKGRVLRRGGGSARGSARRTGARRRDGSARGHRVRGGLAQQGRIIPRRAPVSGLRQRWGTVRTKTHVRAGIRPLGTHGVEFVQLDAFDGHLALDARVPRHLHRAEPAGARFRDRPVAVQYELLMSHDASCAFPVALHAEAPVEPACRGSFLVRFRKRARGPRPLGRFPRSGSVTDYRDSFGVSDTSTLGQRRASRPPTTQTAASIKG